MNWEVKWKEFQNLRSAIATPIIEELVYNILYLKGGSKSKYSLSSEEILKEFERKIGEFYFLGKSWPEFLKQWPEFLMEAIGLRAVPLVGLSADEDFIVELDTESKEFEFCKEYHSRDLISTDSNCKLTIAQYREMLLIGAFKLVEKSRRLGNINRTDANGNTLLHFLAALPGIGGENSEFVKLLLDYYRSRLLHKKNDQHLTPLDIIAGRIQVSGEGESLIFQRERISSKSWNSDYRKNVLDLILASPGWETLSQGSGRDGNTLIHEWVLSTDGEELESEDPEFECAEKLTKLAGSKLDTPNHHGLYPLHLASSFIVFQFLISIGCLSRQRNKHDETPFLFILKYIVALALIHANTSTPTVAEEIQSFLDENIIRVCKKQFLEKAISVLEQLIQLTTGSGTSDTRDTVWMPDKDKVSVLEVVLVCIRVTSYRLVSHLGTKPNEDYAKHVENTKNLREVFVKFLQHILKIGHADYNLRYRNKKGQGPLHVLLASRGTNNLEFNAVPIIECVNILIQHGVNVNAEDDENRKPLDIVNLCHDQFPELYDKCNEILRANGTMVNSSKVPAVRIVQTFSHQHETTLEQLATTTENVTIIQDKYRYFSDKVHVIGTGSFSSTYAALKDEHKDEKSGKIYCRAIALKRVDRGRCNRDDVKREIKVLISPSSQCKNIVDYIETLEDPSFYYICLELMDGDLKDFISNHEMAKKGLHKPAILVQAACDIVCGLMFLHQQDFLHRDLKPGNVLYLVNESDQLCFKISDFGLAKDVSALRSMSSTSSSGAGAPGTLSWMAPELVSGRSHKHTKESDVFALGLVLHYLFTMRIHPYSDPKDEHAHLPHKIQNNLEKGNKFLHSSLSPEAKRFFEVVLEQNAKARPTAKCVGELPFLWTQTKKIEFLRSVGDQDEAARPKKHPNSNMERCLQSTQIGNSVIHQHWNSTIPVLYSAMTSGRKRSSYRGDMVIDLLRFLRNAYAHKEENPTVQSLLQSNVFLQKFPSLVIDVYEALEKNGFLKSRANIAEVLSKKYE